VAAAAEHEAAAAHRVAAARLDQAAVRLPVSPSSQNRIAGSRTEGGGAGHRRPGVDPPEGAHRHGEDRHGGPVRRMVGRALEAGAEVATATHHLVAGAEARLQAAARLASTADDPAVRAAAGRVTQSAARPLIEGRMVGALPLVAPVMDFTAAVSHGEPLPRALAGAIGGAVGADLGGRIGMVACCGDAAATQGAGLIVCPALTAAGGVLGAHVGKTAALHIYDQIAGPPEAPSSPPGPPHGEDAGAPADPRPTPVNPGAGSTPASQPRPEPPPRLESQPSPEPHPRLEPDPRPARGSGSWPDPRPVLVPDPRPLTVPGPGTGG
jgi:hypothetical protein